MADTQRLAQRSIKRIADSMDIPVLAPDLRQIGTIPVAGRVAVPLHIEYPRQVISSVLHEDRYYLTIYQNELVYLHESVPLT